MTDKIVTFSGRKAPGPFDENAYQRGWRDAIEHLAAMAQEEMVGCWVTSYTAGHITLDELEQKREFFLDQTRRINAACAAFIHRHRAQQDGPKHRRAFRPKRKPRLVIVKNDKPAPAA